MITIEDRGKPLTIVAFSGLANENHVFEWARSMSSLPVNFVGMKDPENSWYLSDYRAHIEELREALRSLGTPWVACGASMGGFAALYFGVVFGARKRIAFVPQSASGETKRCLGDLRWPEWCEKTPDSDITEYGLGAEIHIGEDALDVMHAERLAGAVIHRYPHRGHDLPHSLKRDGLLDGILQSAAEGVPA